MMAEEKAYWRVFQQQNVLDGLRIFIDLSDEFLELLRKDDVISEKTLDRIKVGLDQVWTKSHRIYIILGLSLISSIQAYF